MSDTPAPVARHATLTHDRLQQASLDYESDVESLKDSTSDIDDYDDDPSRRFDHEHQPRFQTPPAALWLRSSQDAVHIAPKASPSTTSLLDEEYDMLSMDDAETASLPSVQQDYTHMNTDVTAVLDEHMTKSMTCPQDEYESAVFTGVDDLLEDRNVHNNFLSDDGETPRQSAVLASARGARGAVSRRKVKEMRHGVRKRPFCITFITDSGIPLELEEVIVAELVGKLTDSQVERISTRRKDMKGQANLVYHCGSVDVFCHRCIDRNFDTVRLHEGADLSILATTRVNYTSDGSTWITPLLTYHMAHQIPTLILAHEGNRWALDAELGTSPMMRKNVFTVNQLMEESSDRLWLRIEDVLTDNERFEVILDSSHSTTSPEPVIDKQAKSNSSLYRTFILGLSLLAVLIGMWTKSYGLQDLDLASSDRHACLASALTKHLNTTSVQDLNITHLVPAEGPKTNGFWRFGSRELSVNSNATFITASPNHIIISIPKMRGHSGYPRPRSISVQKGDSSIEHSWVELIDGVYSVDIDPRQAHGIVTVDVLAKPPHINLRVEADLGNRLLRRSTYNKAYTDLSVAVRRDLIVASSNAKALQEVLHAEIKANALIAKSFTEEVGEQVTRDLQLLTNTAIDVWGARRWPLNALSESKPRVLARLESAVDSAQQHVESAAKSVIKALIPSKQISSAREQVLGLQRMVGLR